MLEVKFKLKEILEERNITQKQLAQLANIREATISEIIRGSRTVINFKHLSSIAEALQITDIEKLMVLVETDHRD
ncbi:helix-turn-helix domain-containing protein [Paraclostridium bifermentans]|uniref:helix-turn-helix domain-containing protein n=1 Tax=Paraclostridium bifermentans TaxID=1490 RepID=UPI00374E3AB2